MTTSWRRFSIAILMSAAVQASPRAQDAVFLHPLQNQVVDNKGQVVDKEVLAEKIRQHAYVFVGEKHDNPTHHQIELDIIRIRLDRQPDRNLDRVVFEMLDDAQDALIAKLKPDQNLDEMRQTLEWPAKGWDWNSYGPQFREAVQAKALVSGNVSRAMISAIYKDAQTVFAQTPKLASATKQTPALHNYLLDQIFASHCGMQSRENLQPMLQIQLAKDASMASAMASNSRAVLIAGGEHVRPNTGAPAHLKTLLPNADILIIQLVEAKPGKTKLGDYLPSVGVADLYWFTDATPEQDYCAGVKGRAAQ